MLLLRFNPPACFITWKIKGVTIFLLWRLLLSKAAFHFNNFSIDPQLHHSCNHNLNWANHPEWQSCVKVPHHSSRNQRKSIAAEGTEGSAMGEGSAGRCITPVLCQCPTTHLSPGSSGGNHPFLVNQILLFQPHTAKRQLEPWGPGLGRRREDAELSRKAPQSRRTC